MSYQLNLVKIIKYLRMANDISQIDLAQIMGTSRQKVHRIESLESNINFEEWFMLSDYFGIGVDDVKLGFLNKVETEKTKPGFQIPSRLAQDSFSGGRILFLHKWNYERLLGKETFEGFCKSEKVNPLYFMNLGSSLNMDFNLRLIEELVFVHGKMKTPKEIKVFSQLAHKQTFHHFETKEEIAKRDGARRVSFFIDECISKYEKNHKFEVIDQNLDGNKPFVTVSYSPNEHINKSLYNKNHVSGFFENFIEHYITSLADDKCKIDKVQSYLNRDGKCTFVVRDN